MRIGWLLLALAALGCSDSTGPDRARPNLDSPDDVIDGVRRAFTEGDWEIYDDVLAPEFHFEFQPTEYDVAGTPDGRIDRFQSLVRLENLVQPPYSKAPGASQLLSSSFHALGEDWLEWSDGEFAGSLYRDFEVALSVRLVDGEEYEVNSVGRMTLAEHGDVYRLLHWQELPIPGAREGTSYGRLGAILFRRFLGWYVVGRIESSFEELAFERFESLLHPDYLFEFAAADISASGTPNGIWTRARELVSVQHILTGYGSQGAPPVDSIAFGLTPRQEFWTRSTVPGLEGTWTLNFELQATFVLVDGSRFTVEGIQDFFVRHDQGMFWLSYWRDRGIQSTKSATEGASIGAVKSLY